MVYAATRRTSRSRVAGSYHPQGSRGQAGVVGKHPRILRRVDCKCSVIVLLVTKLTKLIRALAFSTRGCDFVIILLTQQKFASQLEFNTNTRFIAVVHLKNGADKYWRRGPGA